MVGNFGRTIRWSLTVLVLVLLMLVLFSYLVGVSKMDVSVKHEMRRHVVAEPFEAGDIVGLSPDGLRLAGFICDLDLGEQNRSGSVIQSRYYNVVDEVQDDFFTFLERVKYAVNLGGEAGERPIPTRGQGVSTGLDFSGEVSRVVGSIESQMPPECWCEVGRAVLERKEHACVVDKALVESRITETPAGTEIRRTVGLSFRARPIEIADVATLAAVCPGLNAEAIPPADPTCDGQSGVTFDAVARVKVGLIREVPIE